MKLITIKINEVPFSIKRIFKISYPIQLFGFILINTFAVTCISQEQPPSFMIPFAIENIILMLYLFIIYPIASNRF